MDPPLPLQYPVSLPKSSAIIETRVIAGGPGGPGGPGRGQGGAPPQGGQRPSEEEIKQRVDEMRKQGPPQPSAYTMHLSEYKKVDGGMLPHKVGISIEGAPNEEWTIEKFKVNPSIKADDFTKPKQ